MSKKNTGINIALSIDPAQWQTCATRLANIKNGARRAGSAALNKTVTGMRTDATKLVVAAYAIKPNDSRETLTISKASRANLQARLTSKGKSIRLKYFAHSPKAIRQRPAGGVTVTVKRGKSEKFAHAWKNRGTKSEGGIYQRDGTSRTPIREMFGPSVPKMLANEGVLDQLKEQSAARLKKNLNHEIERLAKGHGS